MAEDKLYRVALREALAEEMARDDSVFLIGEDIGKFGGAYRVTDGLLDRFGPDRVVDTPIAEEAIIGTAIGSAMLGLRPVVEMMTINFSLIAYDQIVNNAAKIRYMFGGEAKVPMVIRMPGGAGHQLSAQHSHSFEVLYGLIPGLLVVAPTTPEDAKGMLKSAIRSDNPVMFLESLSLYNVKGDVPAGDYTTPLGKAALRRTGSDITIVGVSRMAVLANEAAKQLEEEDIDAEVIDLRSIRPIDWAPIVESVRRTSRCLVKKGEVIAEVESDKATFDLESEADGVLDIIVQQGVPAKIGAPIARIGAAGEAPAATPAPKEAAPKVEAAKAEKPKPDSEAPAPPPPSEQARPTPLPPAPKGAGTPEDDGAPRVAGSPEVKASPLAKRLAAELGVNLAMVQGSGPEGRIVKEDVQAAAGNRTAPPPASRVPPRMAGRPGPDVEVVEPTRMQATIARRMAEAKSTVPEFTVTVEARVDLAVSMRQQLKDSVPGADKVTMTDFLVRACALALRKFPEVNSSWADGKFQRKRRISIGLAVAPSQGMGLLVPVVHDADLKDLIQISIESRQVIERARSGRPAEGDLSGATFSISNLGMFGVDEFTAIINPPEAAILAVGAIKDVPVVEGGRIVPGKVMRMTLSVDHRVFYGATAAQFMAEVKRLIENPVTLVVPATQ